MRAGLPGHTIGTEHRDDCLIGSWEREVSFLLFALCLSVLLTTPAALGPRWLGRGQESEPWWYSRRDSGTLGKMLSGPSAFLMLKH